MRTSPSFFMFSSKHFFDGWKIIHEINFSVLLFLGA